MYKLYKAIKFIIPIGVTIIHINNPLKNPYCNNSILLEPNVSRVVNNKYNTFIRNYKKGNTDAIQSNYDDFDSKFIIENEHGEKYMYVEIDC